MRIISVIAWVRTLTVVTRMQEVDDLLLVVGEAVGVELLADGRVLRFFFLVLVENPLQRAAVAEFVGPSLGRDAGERCADLAYPLSRSLKASRTSISRLVPETLRRSASWFR